MPIDIGGYIANQQITAGLAQQGIVTRGLILNLDASRVDSYNAGYYTNWLDISGQNNNGTLTNYPVYTSSTPGYFTFDGVDDYVIIPNTASLRPSTEMTISMWIKANNITAGWCRLFGQDPYNGGPLIFLETGGQAIRALHYPNGVEVRCNTNYNISTSVFVNAVFTFKTGDAIRSYFNGVANTTAALAAGTFTYNTSNPYLIGYSGANWYNGVVSNVMVYSTQLSATQVSQNFEALRGRYGV